VSVMNAEEIYAAGGPGALRLATRGAVKAAQRAGNMAPILPEVAVPLVRLANRLRSMGQKAEANSILEHAVHDGVQAAVLAEAVELATSEDHLDQFAPSPIFVGPLGELRAGPPPAADDLASAIELTNYVRDRLLTF
jgi:hypothetical protein